MAKGVAAIVERFAKIGSQRNGTVIGEERLVESFQAGERVSKAHLRIHAYGTVDETNATLGIVRRVSPGLEASCPLWMT